jgi:exopolysaccharide/PEP-CTERM locus tyrosine autokinase
MNMLEKALEKEKNFEKTVNEGKEKQTESVTQDVSLQSVARQTTEFEIIKESENKKIVKFDWDFLSENGYICPDQTHNRIAEEFRSIKRPLVTNALGSRKRDINNANLILVTSSIPGEGKTFTSINLALSIAAEFDKRVLLIDADVAKPSVSRVLGIKSKIGLIDYLETDNYSIADIMLETEVSGLRFIPAGKSHKFSTELLASDKMIALSKELSERYPDRIVIFDTPPLLATTQAEVLASQMGQIILVIGAETTPQQLVMESVKKLQSCSDVVLALLNKAQRTLNAGYYGCGQY